MVFDAVRIVLEALGDPGDDWENEPAEDSWCLDGDNDDLEFAREFDLGLNPTTGLSMLRGTLLDIGGNTWGASRTDDLELFPEASPIEFSDGSWMD